MPFRFGFGCFKLAASKGTVLRLPPYRSLGLAALLALGPGSVFAEELPKHGVPGKKPHEKLVVAIRQRLADGPCRKELDDVFAEYRKAPSEALFLKLAPLAERCGRCATVPVARETERPPGKAPERWYVSDGSCWLGDVPGKAKALAKIREDLLTVRRYPAKNRGYRAIVEFWKTNADGEKVDTADVPEKASPFHTFVAVRGPNLLTPTVATYFVKNAFEAGEASLWLWFKSEPRPEKLKEALKNVELGAAELAVPQAAGQWYVAQDGTLRYTTAADFGFPMPNVADALARRTLLETLVETLVRGDVAL